jgi:hypothetical protein
MHPGPSKMGASAVLFTFRKLRNAFADVVEAMKSDATAFAAVVGAMALEPNAFAAVVETSSRP